MPASPEYARPGMDRGSRRARASTRTSSSGGAPPEA
jgi:hypothetical protein